MQIVSSKLFNFFGLIRTFLRIHEFCVVISSLTKKILGPVYYSNLTWT